jgi:hypothetical protein
MSITTVGPRYPGTFGSNGWTNLSRTSADDASYASAALTDAPYYTEGDYVSGFSFSSDSIPSNAVITEFTVAGEWYGSSTGITFYLQAKTSYPTGSNRGGLQSSEDKTSATAITATYTTNLPTVSELAASTFGVNLIADASGSRTAYCDYIRLSAKYYVPATVTTTAVTSVTETTASSGGNATDDGSGTISARGVCWNTSGSPTIADSKTTNGSGTGSFTSSLTGLWSSTTYSVRAYATTEDGTAYGPEVTFTTQGSSSRSLVARPFTTRAAAAETIVRTGSGIIDWWIEGDVARAEVRPTSVDEVPRSRWYTVSRDTPGASVSVIMDSEDTPDIICVVYRSYQVTDKRDGTVLRAYRPAAPTSIIERVRVIDLTGQYMSVADAETYADNVLLRLAEDVMTASITVRGGLYTVDGHFRPAPLILAGDWIDVLDLPGHVPTYITGTTYSRADNSVTITTGGREQDELVVPGISSLPQALQVYGEVASEVYDPGGDTGGTGGGGDEPDIVEDDFKPGYFDDPGTPPGGRKTGDLPYTPGQYTLPNQPSSGGFLK